ncbi:MAG: hypothetical protein M0P43_00610 [Arcobacteraceae bacterium]|jgi:hypothetical protein|nr:hypothetical protein [Arcobacteraceae bacterium]MDY0327164.1 hypothetical protein [Arcobacteraceae bacterium]
MKNILFLLIPFMLYGQSYMAEIEPYEEFTIYSQTSGQVIKLNKEDETKVVTGILVKLDDSLDQKHLKLYQMQLNLYNEKLRILEENYKNFLGISGKSKTDKDQKYYDVIDMKITINNLKITIEELEDTILKKTISVKNLYIKEFLIQKQDYVNIGMELATAYDISKSKIVVYLSGEDYKDLNNKKVLIDGKDGIATIDKVDITLDDTFVSAHKVILKLDDKNFGKVVKVEFVK